MSLSMPAPEWTKSDSREMALSDMIPYTVHYDDESVITKDDGLLHVIKIDGLYFESLTADQIKQFERRRNTVLRSIANSDRGVYVHLIRRKVNRFPSGEGDAWFSRCFNHAWKERCQQRSFYVNEIYISIVLNRFRQGVPGLLDRAFCLASREKATKEDLESFEKQAKELNEAANLVVQTLSSYGARKLRVQRLPTILSEEVKCPDARLAIECFGMSWHEFQAISGQRKIYSRDEVLDYLGEEYTEIGGFLHYLINLEEERVPVTALHLDRALAVSSIDFNIVSNLLSVQNLSGMRAGAMLSMAEWPARTVDSTDRRNTFIEHLGRCPVSQRFAWALIELPGNRIQAVL